MPSASQLESMQKLCEMMGYNIKYYNSAITDVTVYYNGKEEWKQSLYEIPMFTTFTNSDKSINYFSIESKYLSQNTSGVPIRCMEGQIEQCESDNDNIISIYQLDDQNRYYFNETQIAENGIFVYNVNDGNKSERWTQVSNLNAQKAKSKIYKFGFNSKLAKPYIEFPEDIDSIIEDGLEIYYTRTSGVNGNVTSREISTFMTLPTSLSENLDSALENYTVVNPSSATNGNNVETIRQAYVNYKKTIGTFDTLVTCRDYMNKIYQLTDENGFNLVSNSVVSDINTDINNSITLCTFNDYGICYKQTTVPNATMDNFTLTLYPFKHISNLNTKAEYLSSFQLDRSILSDIQNKIKNIKTLTHKIKLPEVEKTINQNNDNDIKADIVAIKNYLQLKALITTTSKVNQAEQKVIINNIKVAIYEAFNLHNIDFGEEIPYDTILEVMTGADKRIKNVNLFEPAMITKFLLADNTEYVLGNAFSTTQSVTLFNNLSDVEQTARKIYNKLALRNILAGKVPLFNYDTEFKSAFTETRFNPNEDPVFPSKTSQTPFSLVKLDTETEYKIKTGDKLTPAKLTNGQVIQFRSKNLRTLLTYPAYVNYFIQLKHAGSSTEQAQPAKFISLRQYLTDNYLSLEFYSDQYDKKTLAGQDEFDRYLRDTTTVVFKATGTLNEKFKVVPLTGESYLSTNTYYTLDISYDTASGRKNFEALKVKISERLFPRTTAYFSGIYKGLGSNKDNVPGYLVDSTKYKYGLLNFAATNGNFSNYYVQDPNGAGPDNNYNLGKDIVFSGIRKNADYELQTDEFLLINYTKSENSTEASTEEQQESIITKYYGPGTIIKPNFDVYDSQEYADGSNKTFTKTDVDFTATFEDEGVTLAKKIYSMFTLGTDEKIEIREISNIYLDSSTEYLYWNLNNSSNQLRLAWDKTIKNVGGGISLVTYSYSLGENEYIYYTDANKLDMAYYGNGTKVTIYDYIATPLETDTSYQNDRVYYILNNSVSNDTILSSGLNSVPWVKFNFNSRENTGIKTYMVFTEYQYINLIEGDYINNIDLETSPSVHDNSSYIDKNWYKIKNNSVTSYYSNGVYKELSKLNFNIDSDNFNQWEVSAKYILNCGPDLTQTLSSKGDRITAYAINTSELNTLINKHITDKTDLKDLIDLFIKNNSNNGVSTDTTKLRINKFSNIDKAPSLKSNYEIRNLSGSLYTIIQQTDSDSGEDIYLTDFKLKQTYLEGLQTALNSTISQSLHNVASNLTQFKFSDLFNYKLVTQDLDFKPNNDYVKLNMLIPTDNQYGLIMIYYSKTPSDKPNQQNACIRFNINNLNPKIFNYYGDGGTYTPETMDWWEDKTVQLDGEHDYYELKPGINIIYVKYTADKNFMQIFPDLYKENASDTTYKLKCTDVITVSDLSIITTSNKNEFGINYDLVHYFITSGTDSNIGDDISKQLIKDISKIDINNEFYYNLTTDNNNVIDINTEVLDSNGQYESLQSANIWFDKNNINNQFVVGEIDIDSIDKGVQVESSSRR